MRRERLKVIEWVSVPAAEVVGGSEGEGVIERGASEGMGVGEGSLLGGDSEVGRTGRVVEIEGKGVGKELGGQSEVFLCVHVCKCER